MWWELLDSCCAPTPIEDFQRAKDQGLEILHLDADPFAVPFYESLGFKVVSETPSGSIPGRTLPKMEIRLD